MADNQQVPPPSPNVTVDAELEKIMQEGITEKAGTSDNQPTTPEGTPASPEQSDNQVEPDPAKVQLLKRNLSASKEEALRFKAEKELLEKQLQSLKEPAKEEKPIYDFTPEQVAAFMALAEKSGIAKKQDVEQVNQRIYNEKAQDAITRFLGEFPEYNSPGDVDSDERWKILQKEMAEYKTPTNPSDYYRLLKKTHLAAEAMRSKDKILEQGKNIGYAKANIADKVRLGGQAGAPSAPPKNKSTEQAEIEKQLGVSDIAL